MRMQATAHHLNIPLALCTRPGTVRRDPRISRREIEALKHANGKAEQAAPAHLVATLFRDLASALVGGFCKPAARHPMCENYGHVVDLRTWSQRLPKCSDCGSLITNRSQLRGARPIK